MAVQYWCGRGLDVDVDLLHFLQTLCLLSFFASVYDEALVHDLQTERGLDVDVDLLHFFANLVFAIFFCKRLR